MAKTTKTFGDLLPVLRVLPADIWWDVHEREAEFQAGTLEQVQSVQVCFADAGFDVKWHCEFVESDSDPRWNHWAWNAKWNGIKLHMYGCKEAPPDYEPVTKPFVVGYRRKGSENVE